MLPPSIYLQRSYGSPDVPAALASPCMAAVLCDLIMGRSPGRVAGCGGGTSGRGPGARQRSGRAGRAGLCLAFPAQLGMESGPPERTDPGRSTSDAVRLRRSGQRARAGRSLHSGVPAGDRRAHHAREYLRRFLPGYQARLRAFGAIPIDARQPLGHVVDAILSHTLASSATSQASKPSNQPGSPARP